MNVIKETNSIDGLINEMYLYRGSNLSLRPDDLALQGIRSRIYNLLLYPMFLEYKLIAGFVQSLAF